MNVQYLTSGLGGGLDVVNAYLLYSALEQERKSVSLGSVRPVPQLKIENCTPFDESGTTIWDTTIIHENGRYAEPKICRTLRKKAKIFSTHYMEEGWEKDELDIHRLRCSILSSGEDIRFFVDGGGDALTLLREDVH